MGRDRTSPRARGSLLRWLPLAVLLAAMAAAFAAGLHRHVAPGALVVHDMALRDMIGEHFAVMLAAYAMLYVVVVALSVPGGLVLTLAGGYLFGWQVAAPVTVLAATGGAGLVFLTARSALGETLVARAGPRLVALREGFARNALSYMLFLRLVPAFPFWLVNIAPALLGVPFSVFVIGTAVGIIPGTFVIAFLGSGLGGMIAAQRAAYERCLAAAPAGAGEGCAARLDVAAIVTPELIAGLAALGLLALLPVAVKKLRGRRPAGPAL